MKDEGGGWESGGGEEKNWGKIRGKTGKISVKMKFWRTNHRVGRDRAAPGSEGALWLLPVCSLWPLPVCFLWALPVPP